jgi:hypothetical protein
VREFFSLSRAVDLTSAQIEKLIKERQDEGKANATINREIGALKQALNLAFKQERLLRVPYVVHAKNLIRPVVP